MDEQSSAARGCAGVVATARTQGKRTQHGKSRCVIGDDQPDAGDGQAGRGGMAERLVVPRKPGNAGGGKGPQFETNAASGEGVEIGQPSNSGMCPEAADGVARESEVGAGFSLLCAVRQDLSAGCPGACLGPVLLESGRSRAWTARSLPTLRRTAWSAGSGNWRKH